MEIAQPLQVTQRIASVFEKLNIRYLIGGSIASSLYGVPRATQDVDIVADIDLKVIPSLIDALQDEFYIDSNMIKRAINFQSSFNIIYLATMFKADIFILKKDEYSQEEMINRTTYSILDNTDETIFLARAEDIIVHKLFWYKLGGNVSERQILDVQGIIKIQGNKIDKVYLKKRAKQKAVNDLLEQILENKTA